MSLQDFAILISCVALLWCLYCSMENSERKKETKELFERLADYSDINLTIVETQTRILSIINKIQQDKKMEEK